MSSGCCSYNRGPPFGLEAFSLRIFKPRCEDWVEDR